MQIFNTSTCCVETRNGTKWIEECSAFCVKLFSAYNKIQSFTQKKIINHNL
ncbi:MAG: hypothetical protein LBS50_09680 [Prevotellaceae bacterium]|nr:hypothetical protein [Prevotellaceae bacterium]